jgi:predicted nucleic acid-binding protein
MKKLLVDTNIILDLLAKRNPFYYAAGRLFTLADHGKVELLVSALSFANTHYILSRQLPDKDSRKVLRNLKSLVNTVSLDDNIIDLALNSDFKDFEDALQYFSAIEYTADAIITRNQKDFKLAQIPVMSGQEYLSQIN